MKTSFHYSSYGCKSSALEITEAEIISRDKKQTSQYPLPRFISQFETKSHRGANVSELKFLPKVCQINLEKNQEKTNLTGDISQYQLSNRKTQQKHLESVLRNLEHRLQVAKSEGNNFLINLLDNESKELTSSI